MNGLQSAGRLSQDLFNYVGLDFDNLEAGPVVRHQQDTERWDSQQGRQVLMLRQPQGYVCNAVSLAGSVICCSGNGMGSCELKHFKMRNWLRI